MLGWSRERSANVGLSTSWGRAPQGAAPQLIPESAQSPCHLSWLTQMACGCSCHPGGKAEASVPLLVWCWELLGGRKVSGKGQWLTGVKVASLCGDKGSPAGHPYREWPCPFDE